MKNVLIVLAVVAVFAFLYDHFWETVFVVGALLSLL
jgi:hypothetical protein